MKNKVIILVVVLCAISFGLGLLSANNLEKTENFDVEKTEYINISENRSFNPRFRVCQINRFNQTGHFYAANLSKCESMSPASPKY